jgi:hypothetical protein
MLLFRSKAPSPAHLSVQGSMGFLFVRALILMRSVVVFLEIAYIKIKSFVKDI